ncbi:MAG: hypothetical protein IPK99_03945 [Flavobacteriales bacterium]|nr:hypothetical protein [Flavobacteriales bacterium]
MNGRITKPVDRGLLASEAAFWTGRSDEGCAERPDLGALENQFDGVPEKVVRALRNYRREFAQWRADLHRANDALDQIALDAVRHKLRPHLDLLGMPQGRALLDAFVVGSDVRAIRSPVGSRFFGKLRYRTHSILPIFPRRRLQQVQGDLLGSNGRALQVHRRMRSWR